MAWSYQPQTSETSLGSSEKAQFAEDMDLGKKQNCNSITCPMKNWLPQIRTTDENVLLLE